MSYLSQLFRANMSVNDERAWTPYFGGVATDAGVMVNHDTALKISTFWACWDLLTGSVASLPCVTYKRLPNGGREKAANHPLYDVLHQQPNANQTAWEFKQQMTGHVLLRGNAYAYIQPGPRGFADQLIPLNPDWMRVDKLADNSLRYTYRVPGQAQKIWTDSEVLHLRGPSVNGVLGLDVVALAAQSLGLSLASQKYSARFFGNDARPGGVLKHPGKLSAEGAKKLKASWDAAHAGVSNSNNTAVLEEGMVWEATTIDAKQAQFIEREEFQAKDICQWMHRVPPHFVGLPSVGNLGSGIEQLSIGFVTYTLMPLLTMWEQAITRDLILAPDTYYVSFNQKALLKGDTPTRFAAYATARNWGWMSINDIRELEDMNPIEGGDAYLQPLNMQEIGAEAAPMSPEPTPANNTSSSAHYGELLYEAAGRIARKEQAALSKAHKRGDDALDFWQTHSDFVSTTLHIPKETALAYVAEQQALYSALPDTSEWEAHSTRRLVQYVLEAQ